MTSRLKANIDTFCREKSPEKHYCLFRDSFFSIIIDSSPDNSSVISSELRVFLSIQQSNFQIELSNRFIIEEDQQFEITESKINLATQRTFSDGSCFDDHFGTETKLDMVCQGTNSKDNIFDTNNNSLKK